MIENFPKLSSQSKPQTQEAQQTPSRRNTPSAWIYTQAYHIQSMDNQAEETPPHPESTPRRIISKVWTIKDESFPHPESTPRHIIAKVWTVKDESFWKKPEAKKTFPMEKQ